jgi:hypothetical protein
MLRGLLVGLMLLVPLRTCRADTFVLPRWTETNLGACYDLDGAKKLKIFEAQCLGDRDKNLLLQEKSEYQEQRINDLLAAIDIVNGQNWALKERVAKDSILIGDLNSSLKEEREWSLREGAKWPTLIVVGLAVSSAFVAGILL